MIGGVAAALAITVSAAPNESTAARAARPTPLLALRRLIRLVLRRRAHRNAYHLGETCHR